MTISSSRNNKAKYIGTFGILLFLLAVVAFLMARVIELNQPKPHFNGANEGSESFNFHGVYADRLLPDMPSLIERAEIITIADVGEVLAREFPLLYLESQYSEREWATLTADPTFIGQLAIAFHDLRIIEVLKGEPSSNIPLVRLDVEHYTSIGLLPLKPGERLLFFIDVKEGDPNFAKSYDTFYTSFDDIGIFDLEGDRAYPRYPYAFKDSPSRYYDQETDPSRPFFNLEKLRAEINLYK